MGLNKGSLRPYLALMRWHQPTGYWLLLWPCWWSLTLAGYVGESGLPDARLYALFVIGAIAMRSAGCVINDLWDRKIDAQVARTRDRPLASGELQSWQALLLLAMLLTIAFAVLLALPSAVFWLAVLSLPLVTLYPLMKRITWWPQAFLGLTFNFGALMGWMAMREMLEWPAFALYFAGIFWTLGYDTIYAHQDRMDDEKIGVKSTARLLGKHSLSAVTFFYGLTLLGFALAGLLVQAERIYYLLLLLPALHLIWQLCRFDQNVPENCLRLFRSNQITGLLFMLPLLFVHGI